ncbi:MAG: putative CRISPR-associated protein [Gemmataceae bacterium]
MHKPNTLLCTVGTSLFRPNLGLLHNNLAEGKVKEEIRPVAERLVPAYAQKQWSEVASLLGELPSSERLCGAEINSIASLLDKDYVSNNCGLFFFHSATEDAHAIGQVLRQYFAYRGHVPVELVEVEGLQDNDPQQFRTHGLRNLAREMCRVIRDYSSDACAINATGGYKAQIAIAVLLGQALGVPVYYKHEFFSEIIAFPPMPVSLDFEFWMRTSGMLFSLERAKDLVLASEYEDEWDERCESLVERIDIDGEDYIELAATGQIFHDTFRERFRANRDQMLPPVVPPNKKKPPKCDHGHIAALKSLKRFLGKLIEEVPQVVYCRTDYHNPKLPKLNRFRLSRAEVKGLWSDGSETVGFVVETLAETDSQKAAMVALLNEWLPEQ